MKLPVISIIAAIGSNKELGANNKLLWHIPGDLPRFKEITNGHPIVMGRKTYESIGRILPGRTNIIISRDQNYKVEGAVVVESLEKAIKKGEMAPGGDKEIFIIGGGQIFTQAMPITDKLYLTIIYKSFPEADVFFPDYKAFTSVISRKENKGPEFNFTYLTLQK